MGKLSTIITSEQASRGLLVASFFAVDSWKLYLIFRNIKFLRDSPDAPLELDITPTLYNKMLTLTQYQAEHHLLATIIELSIKVAKFLFNYFQYIWILSEDYAIILNVDRLVARALVFCAIDNCIGVAVAIPLELLSSLLTGEGNPILLLINHVIDMAFRATVASVSAFGIIYLVNRFGVVNIFIYSNLLLNFLGVILMSFYYKCMMDYNYERLSDSETGTSILELAKEVGFPGDDIFIDKSAPEPNAYYSSAVFASIITITEPLLNSLDAAQVTSVVAHELGHWAHCHQYYNHAIQIIEAFAVGYFWVLSYGTSDLIKVFQLDPDVHPFVSIYAAFYFIWPSFSHLFHGVFNIFKTYCEFVADDYACKVRGPKPLVQALVNISAKMNAFPLLDSCFTAWFVGHPSIIHRIRRIAHTETK